MNRLQRASLLFVLSLLIAAACLYYWYEVTYYPDTDDAYVKADIINIAPNVSGTVAQVFVADNDFVHKGQLLYRIDKKPFQIAVEKAEADLALYKQSRAALFESVENAKALIAKSNAYLEWAKSNYQRIRQLVKNGRASIADGDKARSEYLMAKAALISANSQFSEAMVKLGANEQENAPIQQAKALLKQAVLNLTYTEIFAPKDGIITHFSLKAGDMAKLGQNSVSLVVPSHYWVEANFKETQLKRLKKGQDVTLTLDMEPDKRMHGKIESISASTGQTFALIPQENAGGNWVKVTQRVPVKIAIVPSPKNPPLRVGASVVSKVNTKRSQQDG